MILLNSLLIVVIAIPLVWLIGYQDHQWRSSSLSLFAAVLLSGASWLLIAAAVEEEPPMARWWPGAAVAVSSASLLAALFWALTT
jgi:hypothetical protein